jgi:multidrug transporter EmrE-like cation transporter
MKKYFAKLPPLATLFVGGLILTFGDIVAAQWIRFGGAYLYLVVLFFYLIGMMFLIASYKTEDIPVASIILVIFNVTILAFVGAFLFGEELTIGKVAGIILCFISIWLLQYGKKRG